MDARWWLGGLMVAACATGCDDGGGGDAPSPTEDGGGGTGGTQPDAMPTDDAEAPADLGPPPDMGPPPPACFADGARLVETSAAGPWAGASDLRADLDVDGDGAPDLVIELHDADGTTFVVLDAATLAETTRFTLAGAVDAEVMPGLWPPRALIGAAEGRWVVATTAADGSASLLVLDGAGAVQRTHALPGGPAQVTVMNTGTAWRVLVNAGDGACQAYDLAGNDPLFAEPGCRVRPAWDVDGDGQVDIARDSLAPPTAGALLSGADGHALGTAEKPVILGFNPISDAEGAAPPGPAQLRAAVVEPDDTHPEGETRGLELLGISIDDRLNVGFLDPDTLAELDAVTPQMGMWKRAEVHGSVRGMRLWTQFEINGLQFVAVYQVGDFIRQLINLGPYEFVQWGLDTDLDDDGYPDLRITGGPRDDLRNAPIHYVDTALGNDLLVIEADRSGRFDQILLPTDGGPRVVDLDGCEGAEILQLRTGIPARSGLTGTRLDVLDAAAQLLRGGPPIDGFLHVVRLADLDGDGRPEVLELRSTDEQNADLHISRPGAAP